MARVRKARKPVNTDRAISLLKPEKKTIAVKVKDLPGLYVRVTPNGAKNFSVVARSPDKVQVWSTIDFCSVISIDDAREEARKRIRRIKDGLDPVEAPPAKPDSFDVAAEEYLTHHVRAKGRRTEAEIVRILESHIYPRLGTVPFREITLDHITPLLDAVAKKSGARSADTVLTVLRAIMRFYATRHANYIPPIVPGMRRDTAKPRTRTLNDDELRTVWKIAEGNGTFGAILRLALLTAQRREKIATMKWGDVSLDGIWEIPAPEDREKGNAGALVLPDIALDIIRGQKRIGNNPHIFAAARGGGPFSGWSPCKRRFDEKVTATLREESGDEETAPLPHWTVHDLRRTARSLMARAKVRPDIAERVMGHVQPGVEGVYDRHTYRDEKADALKRLAALIETILNPPTGNVVRMRGDRATA